jgi:hypothetical protein
MLPAGNRPVLNDNQSTKKSQPLILNNNYSVPQNVQLIPSTSYQQQPQQQHQQMLIYAGCHQQVKKNLKQVQ